MNERVSRPKFIPEADQRFFFFRNPADAAHPPTNVWGARVGVLFPNNLKIGIGYSNSHFGSYNSLIVSSN